MKLIKQVIILGVYILFFLFFMNHKGAEEYTNISYIALLLLVPYCFWCYRFFIMEKDTREVSAQYNEIDKIYKCKKDRYKNLYNHLYKLYTSRNIEDKLILRTIKSGYVSDSITLPMVGTVVAVFTIFFNKLEMIFSAIIRICTSLLKVGTAVDENVKNNYIGLLYIEIILILIIMIKKMIETMGEKAFVKSVLEDVENDLKVSE